MMAKAGKAAIAAVVAGLAALPALAGEPPRAVIELFTSQGCSSCPPADALLGEYADRRDVLALSYAVDYWDYLGWKDTLASQENTARQKGYAQARGDGQVYTPQIVVAGREHLVGSNRAALEASVRRDLARGFPVPIILEPGADATTVSIGAAPDATAKRGTIWLAMFDRAVTVPISRGENTGKSITYNNVVRKLRPIAMWKGEAMTIDLPKSELVHEDVTRCAVILQTETGDGLPGPILGAATIKYEKIR
jgi:hypothetical protein